MWASYVKLKSKIIDVWFLWFAYEVEQRSTENFSLRYSDDGSEKLNGFQIFQADNIVRWNNVGYFF